MRKRNFAFALGTLVAMALYWAPLKALVGYSFESGIYSYITVVPFISAGLIYLQKVRIFSRVRSDVAAGSFLILLAVGLRLVDGRHSIGFISSDSLSLAILSFVVLWIGVFVLCYGIIALRGAAFQASLLILIVPLPSVLLERAIFVLRGCSAQTAAIILKLGGVPVFRNGFRLSLPGTDVEVAKECSGIRSAFALLITSLLMGHLFLRSAWGKFWLAVAILPVTIFKNGLRIVVIYLLTVDTSMHTLTLWVHHYGGIPVSFLGLSILGFLAISLRRFEEDSAGRRETKRRKAALRRESSNPSLDLTC